MIFQFAGFGRGANIFSRLEQYGVFDGLFPFILIYVLAFSVLQKTKILGKDDQDKPHRKFNAVVSLVFGAAFVYPHYTGQYLLWGLPDPVMVINSAIPQVGVMMTIIILLLVLLGLFGVRVSGDGRFRGLQIWLMLFSIGYVSVVMLNATGVLTSRFLWFLNDPDFVFFSVFIAGFVGLIAFLSSEKKPRQPNEPSGIAKLLDSISEGTRGKKLGED